MGSPSWYENYKPPHCDQAVLHKPGACQFCDALPSLQAAREAWGINFTGEKDPNKAPCPSERRRPVEKVHAWPGNRPSTFEHEDDGPAPFEGKEPPLKITLSGKPADPNYNGPAPQPIESETGMHKDYWVLSEGERAKGFVRPVRTSYRHEVCGHVTHMNHAIAETYARDPYFYSATFCATCRKHFPVGENGEFTWTGSIEKVGT